MPQDTLLTVLVGLGLLGLVLVMLRTYKQYRERVLLETARAGRRAAWQQAQADNEDSAAATDPLPLTLLWLDETSAVKQEFAIESDTVTVGRVEMVGQITLADRSVSPLHARVRWRNGRYWLTDEGSENGVFLNHERLGLSPRPLADGDLIQLGRVSLRTRIGEQVEGGEGEQVSG
ncbi:MAG: FHA domain-containing protein [Chloroflexi bacterium]|nr:FHA domain-containing protein [Chloroflexota bacterium]NOG37684.1 FHA domain-containing protein [Chloroflexota bacterium]